VYLVFQSFSKLFSKSLLKIISLAELTLQFLQYWDWRWNIMQANLPYTFKPIQYINNYFNLVNLLIARGWEFSQKNPYMWVFPQIISYFKHLDIYNSILAYNYSKYKDCKWGYFYSIYYWVSTFIVFTPEFHLKAIIFVYSVQQGLKNIIGILYLYLLELALVKYFCQVGSTFQLKLSNIFLWSFNAIRRLCPAIPNKLYNSLNIVAYNLVIAYREIRLSLAHMYCKQRVNVNWYIKWVIKKLFGR